MDSSFRIFSFTRPSGLVFYSKIRLGFGQKQLRLIGDTATCSPT
jgi:hypothetical protein